MPRKGTRPGDTHRDIWNRLWRRVDRTPEEAPGCWLWRGAHDRHGYGLIGAGGDRGQNVRVNRLAYELQNGEIPEGYTVEPSCGEHACVRHLVLVSEPTSGARNPNAKLTPAQVDKIRALYARGVPMREIARGFGITREHGFAIVAGTSWAKRERPPAAAHADNGEGGNSQ